MKTKEELITAVNSMPIFEYREVALKVPAPEAAADPSGDTTGSDDPRDDAIQESVQGRGVGWPHRRAQRIGPPSG